jgi:hypothetical protein
MFCRFVLTASLAALLLPVGAHASQLVDRNASAIRLGLGRDGVAVVTYRARGATRRVLFWGAAGARPPTAGVAQVRLRADYTGGLRTFGRPMRPRACGRYDGPPLAWLVAACKASDGSYWALQSWQPQLPHRGFPAWRPAQTDWWLSISHWRGEPAQLEVHADWAFGNAPDLFGRLTYGRLPVYALTLGDTYGRNLYIDTYDSAYGAGWRRETSILTRGPSGVFCYSFWPTRDSSLPGAPYRPAGKGTRYRITVKGPGVTPDVMWEGPGVGDFDPGSPADVAYEASMNALLDQLAGSDAFCKTQH